MLSMRPQQMAELDDFAVDHYVARTLAHLLRYFPAHGEVLGEERIRLAIRLGWPKAKAYGFGPECCARSYAEFMCLLGTHFDSDPLLPWAGAILREQDNFDPVGRADMLYERVWRHVNRGRGDFLGPNGQPMLPRYLQHLAQLDAAADGSVDFGDPALPSRIKARLWNWMPEKCASVGDALLAGWVERMLVDAQAEQRSGEKDVTLMVLLAYLWGRGFTDDPLVPWGAGDPARPPVRAAGAELRMTDAADSLRRWWPMASRIPSP
jgi:hypothetical protein